METLKKTTDFKDNQENRTLIEEYFKNSEFRPAGRTAPTENPFPFILYGIGWGEMYLRCICINFGGAKVIPHIHIEFSPCSSRSKHFYMNLTKENILKLPKTMKEFNDDYFEKMSYDQQDIFFHN